MGKVLYKAFKIFLWCLFFAVLAGLVFLLVRSKGWPLWTGGAILLGPIGVIAAIIYLRRHLFRRREKKFVKRIVEQEPDKLVLAQAANREYALNDLRASFARAREIFKRSRLTRFSNPAYALPWFLMAGQTGSGKSSALRSAHLDSLQTDLNPAGTSKPGGLCEWWFQKNAVILDVTGRFMDTDADEVTWREFLSLLARHRRRAPLSGLVLTIPATSLTGDHDHTITAARALRQRIDELMRVLGARFPVYLLVTKLDTVPGFDGFAARLNADERRQAMGALNILPPDMPEARAGDIMEQTTEAIKTLRLLLLDRPGDPDPGLTRFPGAFAALEDGLKLYCRELFQKNPYLETPLFRGMYFACARHEATSGSGATPAGATATILPGAFLHDLFARILPDDRRLHSPLPAFLTWRNVTRFAALAAALALTLSAAGLFTYSYMRNTAALSFFANEFGQVPKLTNDLAADVDLMMRFRNVLRNMERENASWALPRLGFTQSREAETKLKQLYCELFRRGVQDQFDWMIGTETMGFTKETAPDHIQNFASYLLNRIRLLDAAQHGTADRQAVAMLHEELLRLTFGGVRVSGQFADRYESLHRSYLAWNSNPKKLVEERTSLARLLERVLRVDRLGLGWLVGWANELPGLSAITMDQFWDTVVLEQHGLSEVPPAFTLKGRSVILREGNEIQRTLQQSVDGPDWMTSFTDWYAAEYVATWGRFAQGFASAIDWQRNEDQWREITTRMAEPDNPYLMLLTVMGDQLAPFANRPDNPAWVAPVMAFNAMRQQALTPKKAALEQKVSSDISQVGAFFDILSSFVTKSPGDDKTTGAPGAAGKAASGITPPQSRKMLTTPSQWSADLAADKGLNAFKAYLDALKALREASRTPVSSVGLVAPKYSPAAGQPASPFDTAEKTVTDLQAALDGQDSSLFKELLVSPLRFFWGLAVVDAAEGLQKMWEENVLVKVGQMPKQKLAHALFDDKTGLVWTFVNGPAAPFLGKTGHGYSAKVSSGTTFPFTKEFLNFLNRGATENQTVLPSYQVTATALPTDVNIGAQQRPYATTLTLDCQEKVQQLVNYNYPVTQVFNWNPNTCGTTTLTVKFKSFTATKNYPGTSGFSNFLKEFQYDAKKFTPQDFPEAADNFAIYGVNTITVQYKLSGGVPILGLRKVEHINVPNTITTSWGY